MNTRILAGAFALFLIAVSLQIDVDRHKLELERRLDRPFVPPRTDLVRVAMMGYQTILADAYWLRAIQNFIGDIESGRDPDDLYPMSDFITDLDPRFCFAYFYTGLNLMLNGGRASQVRDILEKGKVNCPSDHNIPFHLGFFYYYMLERYELAAENMERAYELTGFRNYALLAARIRAEGGKPETAIQMLTAMIKNTDDPRIRDQYLRRIAELQAQIILNGLNLAVEDFARAEGRYPENAAELLRRVNAKRLPEHPVLGHRFVYHQDRRKFDNDPQIYTGVFNPRRKNSLK